MVFTLKLRDQVDEVVFFFFYQSLFKNKLHRPAWGLDTSSFQPAASNCSERGGTLRWVEINVKMFTIHSCLMLTSTQIYIFSHAAVGLLDVDIKIVAEIIRLGRCSFLGAIFIFGQTRAGCCQSWLRPEVAGRVVY